MHKRQPNHFLRDVVLLAVLCGLVTYMYKRTYSYLVLHKKSLIHQLDRSFADQLYSAQRQVRIAKTIAQRTQLGKEQEELLQKLSDNLETIEAKYTKNSPALAFLGPIGSTHIVLKEQELENQLLEVLTTLSQLLHTLTGHATPLPPTTSIDQARHMNQTYIAALLKRH